MGLRRIAAQCMIPSLTMEIAMGGIGSGARRSTQVRNVEDTMALDIRVLRRLGALRSGECIIDDVYWSKGGLRTASARLRVDLSDIDYGGTVTITGRMPDGAINQRIAVDALPSAFGGHRWYFVCPVTAERCEVLYHSGGRFASRRANRLSYAVQGMTDLSRARRKVAKLRSRLDGCAGYPRCRGSNRIEVVGKLERAKADAHALFIGRLHASADRSGSR